MTARRCRRTICRRCAPELFSADQMEQHGEDAGGRAQVDASPRAGPAPAAARRERGRADRRLQSADRGGAGEPPHHAGGRMAARQFLPDRRADPHRQAASAQGLQPRAAAAGAAARRPGFRGSTTSRWRPIAHGDGRVDPESLSALRRGLPDRHAAQAGRAVGDSDHAAAGADRESAPRRDATSPRAASIAIWPTTGPTR